MRGGDGLDNGVFVDGPAIDQRDAIIGHALIMRHQGTLEMVGVEQVEHQPTASREQLSQGNQRVTIARVVEIAKCREQQRYCAPSRRERRPTHPPEPVVHAPDL